MRRFTLVFLLFFLAGCVPILNMISRDSDKGELRLKTDAGGATITFAAGEQNAEDVALYISGNDLSIEDDKCAPEGTGMGCILGTIVAGESYEVRVRGSKLSTNVTYYRPGSARPFLLLAEVQ
jgi:hypothetical protein